MAFSMFAQTVDDLIKARENELVQKLAAKYNLSEEELRADFNLGAVEVKAKKQYKKRTAKEVTVTGEDGQPIKAARKECTAITAKKEPCKFAALKNCDFCKRHQKAFEEQQKPKEPATGPIKPAKETLQDPVHNHFMDGQAHEDCELCQIQGPPDADQEEYEELVPAQKTQLLTEEEDEDPFGEDD